MAGWLSYRLVISRHRAKVLQNSSKGMGRHLHRPGKRSINDDGRHKSRENDDRQHARHQRLRPEVPASEEKSVNDRYESASEQGRPYHSRYESCRIGEPGASHLRDRVDLTQNFGDQGGVASLRRLEPQQRFIDTIQRLLRGSTRPTTLHGGPVTGNNRSKIVGKSSTERDAGLSIDALRQTIDVCHSTCFRGDGVFSNAEPFPDDDDREGK